jgi:hypothetical protein
MHGSAFFKNVAEKVRALRPTSEQTLAAQAAAAETLIKEATDQADVQLVETKKIVARAILKARADFTYYQNLKNFSAQEKSSINTYTQDLIKAYQELYDAELRSKAISLQLARLLPEKQKNPTDSTLQSNIRELNAQSLLAQRKIEETASEIRTNQQLMNELISEAVTQKMKAEKIAAKKPASSPPPLAEVEVEAEPVPKITALSDVTARINQIEKTREQLERGLEELTAAMEQTPGGSEHAERYPQILEAAHKNGSAYEGALFDEQALLAELKTEQEKLKPVLVQKGILTAQMLEGEKRDIVASMERLASQIKQAQQRVEATGQAWEKSQEDVTEVQRTRLVKGKEKVIAPPAVAARVPALSPRPILRKPAAGASAPAPAVVAKPKQVAFASPTISAEAGANVRGPQPVPIKSVVASSPPVQPEGGAARKDIKGIISNFNELPKLEKQVAQRATLAQQLEVLERQQRQAEGDLNLASLQAAAPKALPSVKRPFKGAEVYVPAQNVAKPQEAVVRATKSVADNKQKIDAVQKQLDEIAPLSARIDQLNNEISVSAAALQNEQEDTAKSVEDLQNEVRATRLGDPNSSGLRRYLSNLSDAVLAGQKYEKAISDLNAQLEAFNKLKEEEKGLPTSASAVKAQKALLAQKRSKKLGDALKIGKGVETAEAFDPNKDRTELGQRRSNALAAEVAKAEKKLLAQEEKMNTLGADFKRKQRALKSAVSEGAPADSLTLVAGNIAGAKNFLSRQKQLAGAYSGLSKDEKKAWDANIKDVQQMLTLYQEQEKALKGGFTTKSTLYKDFDDQISYLKTQINVRGLSPNADITFMLAVLNRQLADLAEQIRVLNEKIKNGGTDLSKVQAQRDSMQRYREQLIELRTMVEDFSFYQKSKEKTTAGLSQQAAAIRQKALSMVDLQANLEDTIKQVADQRKAALQNASMQMMAAGAPADDVKRLKSLANAAPVVLQREAGKLTQLKNWFAQNWSKNWKVIVPIVIALIAIPVVGITLFELFAPVDHKRAPRNMALFIQRVIGVGVNITKILYTDLEAAYDKMTDAGYNITTISNRDLLRITGFVPTLPISQPPRFMRSYGALQKDKKRILV